MAVAMKSITTAAAAAPVARRAPAPRQRRAAPRAEAAAFAQQATAEYFEARTEAVSQYFEGAREIGDFFARAEVMLGKSGFNGENTICMAGMCRDEVVEPARAALQNIFTRDNVFFFNGLGGVLMIGKIGMAASKGHSPTDPETGKERYVFVTFPHIAVDSTGKVGSISRRNRPAVSGACGALCACLANLQAGTAQEGDGTVVARLDPEYSILEQRMNAFCSGGKGPIKKAIAEYDLVDLTKQCEAMCLADLEELIAETVDTGMADYAVISGVHIHSFTPDYNDPGPNMEFIYPGAFYTVVDGERVDHDINAAPITQRQLDALLA